MSSRDNLVSVTDAIFRELKLSEIYHKDAEKKSFWKLLKNIWKFILIASLVLLMVTVIFGGYYYSWSWVGVVEYSYENGAIKEISRIKTMWDWFELLFIPLVLAIGAWWLNKTEKDAEQKSLEERLKNERRIAHDSQQHTILESYLEKISDLLLNHGLRTSQKEDEVRVIARITTLTVLRVLDGLYKSQIVKFLYESNLINTDDSHIDLQGADLSHINLAGEHLPRISLSGAILAAANFEQADLSFANFKYAKFTGVYTKDSGFVAANLQQANLTKANLEHAILAGYDLIDLDIKGEFEAMGADMSQANLTSANLQSANFTGNYRVLGKSSINGAIKFKGVNLTGANLTRANLTDALIWSELLDSATTLEGAILPHNL